MRNLLILIFLLASSTVALAQKDQFPLTAKVTSSDSESVPIATRGSTSQTTAMPGTIWQHQQQHQSTTISYGSLITVTAQIENRVYRLSSPRLLAPGDYPASIEKNTVRILVKDKDGRPKTIKMRIASVAEKQ